MVLVISYRNELGEMDFCHQGDEPLILIGIGNFENIQVRNAAKGMCSPGELLKIYSAKGKGKLVPVFNRAPRHEGVLGEWGYSSTPLTSVLEGGGWSAPADLPPGKEPLVPIGWEAGCTFHTLWRSKIHTNLKINADGLNRHRRHFYVRRMLLSAHASMMYAV